MNLIKVFIFTFLFAMSHSATALKSDSKQPVHIDSNTASYNDKKGISIYTGNVVTIQGSLHITSDKLIVYLKEGDIDKMVFTGKPAKFRQLPGKGQEEIHGQGLTGEYYPNLNKLILIEKAVVSQGNSKSTSKLIVYDSKNSLIKAGEQTSDDKRVHTVFGSNNKSKEKTKESSKKNETVVENVEKKPKENE